MQSFTKWIFKTALCFGLLSAGVIAAAAQTTTPAASPTVDQILEKYIKALGGKEAVEKITSRVAKGNFEMEQLGEGSTTEIYAKAPDKQYTVTTTPMGDFKRGYNGTVGWQDNPQVGLADLTGGQLADMKRGSDFYRDIKLKELYPKQTLKGKEAVNGKDTYVVE